VPFGAGFFYYLERGTKMDSRIALIGIIVENVDSAEKINLVLHEYAKYIIGRMGVPYSKRNVSVISVVIDAPNNVISAISGKLGMLPHVSTKTVYSKITSEE
jgi:putative iron-only hydrogenase system regulator